MSSSTTTTTNPPSTTTTPSPAFTTSRDRWLALSHRTPSAHNSFLYGVKTTRIFCRPTCPARLARRANIIFYNTASEARRDGFRPCKRCQPENAAYAGEGTEVVTRTIACLVDGIDREGVRMGLREVAREVGVTPSYLCRVFKRVMGVTVGEYKRGFERGPSSVTTAATATTAESSEVESPYSMATESTRASTPPSPALPSAADLSFTPDPGLDLGKDVDLDWDVAMDLEFSFDDWLYGDDVTHMSDETGAQAQDSKEG